MVAYKLYLGIISSVVASLAYIPYFRDIFQGRTKPHVFSWFIWGLLASITFSAQIIKGAGPGAWANGITGLICFIIAFLSFSHGEKKIVLFDWLAFSGALLGLALWAFTDNPLWAVILAAFIDTLAYLPTFRKAYLNPYEETMVSFILTTAGIMISLLALQSYNPVTWIYPSCLVCSNSIFITMLFIRRRAIARQ